MDWVDLINDKTCISNACSISQSFEEVRSLFLTTISNYHRQTSPAGKASQHRSSCSEFRTTSAHCVSYRSAIQRFIKKCSPNSLEVAMADTSTHAVKNKRRGYDITRDTL
jgi:hypothetical protein